MSDKLQFVVPRGNGFYQSIDKLKFIGHPIQSRVALGLATALQRVEAALEKVKLPIPYCKTNLTILQSSAQTWRLQRKV